MNQIPAVDSSELMSADSALKEIIIQNEGYNMDWNNYQYYLQNENTFFVCTVMPNFFKLHYTVPEAVDLLELNSTTDSITAHWLIPNGIVESYDVFCEEGTPSEVTFLPSWYLSASCVDLPIPGDDYRIEVTAVSNGQRSQTDSITITASM